MLQISPRDSVGPENLSPGDETYFWRVSRHGDLDCFTATFRKHIFPPHTHETYVIGVTLDGVHSYMHKGVKVRCEAGTICFINPDEVHDGRAGAERGFRYRMLYIAPRLIAEALGGKAGTLPFVRSAVSSDPRLLDALFTALADLSRPFEPLERDRIVARIADALLALDASQRAPASFASSAVAVDRARAFLDENFMRMVASEELESVTGLDRYTLARHFRRRLGTSPYRYLTMRRLDHVKSAVIAGHPLAEAAFIAGFADQSHMTRQFKRAFGMTPGHWQAIRN